MKIRKLLYNYFDENYCLNDNNLKEHIAKNIRTILKYRYIRIKRIEKKQWAFWGLQTDFYHQDNLYVFFCVKNSLKEIVKWVVCPLVYEQVNIGKSLSGLLFAKNQLLECLEKFKKYKIIINSRDKLRHKCYKRGLRGLDFEEDSIRFILSGNKDLLQKTIDNTV